MGSRFYRSFLNLMGEPVDNISIMKPGAISYEIIKTRQGLESLVVSAGGKEYPLHSRVNPERDGDLFRGKLDPSRYDLLIVLGTGLGYHLLPVREEAASPSPTP